MNKPVSARWALPASVLLVALCVAQFLDAMDLSSMGIVLPLIQREFGISVQLLQWVVSGYVLGFGGFLLLGGRIADLFGRRRVFLLSMLLFGLLSLTAGLASNGWMLIAARIAKGIAAGFTAPAALSLLLGLYKEPAERNRALGLYSVVAAAGFALGAVIGGLMGDISWRLTSLLPLPIALGVVGVIFMGLPPDSTRKQTEHRFDLEGAILVTMGLLAVVYGATQTATYGWWSWLSMGPLGLGLLLLAAFLAYEHHRAIAPLMPLSIFKRPGLSSASVNAFLMQGTYTSFQFLAVLYFQNVLKWSAFESSLAFVFGGLMVALGATKFARLALKFGPSRIVLSGVASLALAFVWFWLGLGHVPSVLLVAILQLLLGLGFAAGFPSVNIKALANTREEDHGLASGIILSAFSIGGGLVVAVVASTFAASHTAGLGRYFSALHVVIVFSLVNVALAVLSWRAGKQRLVTKGIS